MRSGAPPIGCVHFMRAATKGGEEGGAYGAQLGVGGGSPYTAARAPSVQPRDGGGGGTPHLSARANRVWTWERRGYPNQSSRYLRTQPEGRGGGVPPRTALYAPCAQAGDRVGNPNQAVRYPSVQTGGVERGEPPRTSACAPCAWHAGEVVGGNPEPGVRQRGTLPSSVRSPHTACRGGGRGGPRLRGGGGGTPRSEAHALRVWPDTGDGGNLQRPAMPPLPQDESGVRGKGRKGQHEGDKEKAHRPH